MFARVQTVQQPAEKLDELTRLAQEQLPAARALPGFSGFYYLVDREHEKAIVISLWETAEHVRQLESSNHSVRERVKAEAGVDAPASEVFEVAVHIS